MNNKKIIEKPKLLIYAHYYYPDVASTGQILKELAEGMRDSFHITVVCVVPSYQGKVEEFYKKKKYYYENIEGISVIRVKVPEFSKTNKISRIKNILVYFLRAVFVTMKMQGQDYVYSISQPPVLGGVLGWMGKAIHILKGAHPKFIYNIQDFNPEQTMAVGYIKNRNALKLVMAVDKFSCRRADKVIVVGRDMIETLKKRFRGKETPRYCFINNWIDEKQIYPLAPAEEHVALFKKSYGLENKLVIMYSGNLGLYYDLENILKVIAGYKNKEDVIFAFVGEGSVLDKLKQYKNEERLDNVAFIPYQDKEELIYSLNAGDVHWVVNAKGIKGVSVPSKLYGVMAVGKPIIGVLEEGSEARRIIEETGCGYVVEPGHYEDIRVILDNVIANKEKLQQMGNKGREYLLRNLTKDISIGKYIEEIKSC